MPPPPSILSLLAGSETPALGPRKRDSALGLVEVRKQIDTQLETAHLAGDRAQLVRALVLLWHDHLEASHELSQGVHTPDGSYVHGLMHRREPDFGNAAYWVRRVGEHAIYPQLAREVGALPGDSGLRTRLTGGHRWHPLAMIDACEAVEVEADDAGDAEFLREVQAVEFRLLLQHF